MIRASAASGEVITAATTVAAIVVTATTIAGMPKRMMYAKESMSFVVRATRSPVPARSTTESGSLTDEPMKSSRSRAKMRSERTNDALRATQVSAVWATSATTSTPMSTSMRARLRSPVVTSSTTWPTTHGPSRATSAARPCQTSTQVRAPRWWRSSTLV